MGTLEKKDLKASAMMEIQVWSPVNPLVGWMDGVRLLIINVRTVTKEWKDMI